MLNKNVIQVFEHDRLTMHSDSRFTKKHLKALISFNDNNDNKYFKVIRDGVRFSQYVGVIQAGNLTIEILPKADKNAITEESAKPLWHMVLLNMLKECRLLKIDHVEKAQLNLRSNSLLEIYLELFLTETEQLLREGLIKKYKPSEGNKTALKGRLHFGKNIAYNLVHQERFYVNYTEYSLHNVFNQLLLKTLHLIPKISNTPWFSDRVNRILLDFPELPDCKVSSATFEKLVFDRKTERYKEALLISKMLLLNYRPDISGGSENVIAILFDMNKLWEEFVYRRLKREETNFGVTVRRQQSADFWKQEMAFSSKKIRPDIVITQDDKTIIIDTKWKVMTDLIPDDGDLKQMFVYNLFWNCDRSILLYPAVNEISGYGDYHDFRREEPFYTQCSVETVNILDSEKSLDKRLGQKIFETIIRPIVN